MTSTGEAGQQRTPQKLPKFLEKEKILKILDKAKKTRTRDYIFLETLWRTGIRVDEIVDIKKSDIKEDGTLLIRGKGKKERMIPLEKNLETILRLYMDSLSGGEQTRLFDFTTRTARNICYKYSPFHTKKIPRFRKHIKVYEAHPHTFRHSFAVNWIKCGGNLRSLQKILGHSRLETTSIYLDLTAQDLKEDMEKVDFE